MGIKRIIKRNRMKKVVAETLKREKVSMGELKRNLKNVSLKEKYNMVKGVA